MSDWKEVIENGSVYYVNEEVGTIIKTAEGLFIACFPKIVKMGPFDSLTAAQSSFEFKNELDASLDQYNAVVSEKLKS